MRPALALVLALAASGCATLERFLPAASLPPAPWTAPERSMADELVAYAGQLRGMGDGALAAEAARQKREPGDLSKLKAAMALALSQSSEESEILSVVDPIARSAQSDAQAKALAGFLQAMVQDRRRLKESAAAAGARLRDERKALEAQKQRADALQERAAQLQQKIDALTELEKSLSDRTSGR